MRYVPLILASIALAGCNEKQGVEDIDSNIQEKKVVYASPIEPAPDYKSFQTYDYQNTHMRGPFEGIKFEPIVKTKTGAKNISPDFNRKKEELEKYHTDSFSMVGTLGDSSTRTAILKYSDGSYYNVKKGNYIGQNHGKIVDISDRYIRIYEIVSDGQEGWEEREVVLGLVEVNEKLIDKETAESFKNKKNEAKAQQDAPQPQKTRRTRPNQS